MLLMVLLCACEKKGIKTERTNNDAFHVTLLFEHEGIKVFRFFDGSRFHYFTSKGECIAQQTKVYRNGKTTTVSHYDENL